MNHCEYCQCRFTPTRKNQKYCTNSTCRRRRKREWQKNKLKNDPDYREAQQEAQKRWRKSHPDYWQKYREQNPQYTDRNRHLQGTRNKKRSKKNGSLDVMIAKMDAKPSLLSGAYYIFPVSGASRELIAKMDAKVFEIQPVKSEVKKSIDCKERTHTHRY
jgi:hypothetical protein